MYTHTACCAVPITRTRRDVASDYATDEVAFVVSPVYRDNNLVEFSVSVKDGGETSENLFFSRRTHALSLLNHHPLWLATSEAKNQINLFSHTEKKI